MNVARLLREPGQVVQVTRSGPIADLEVTAARVVPGSIVEVDTRLEAVSAGILATGTVRAIFEAECRRCLGLASGELEISVRELFSSAGDPELCYPFRGEQIDLEPMAHDAVLLELPAAPLCRSDCRGLCSLCGADLNGGACRCNGET